MHCPALRLHVKKLKTTELDGFTWCHPNQCEPEWVCQGWGTRPRHQAAALSATWAFGTFVGSGTARSVQSKSPPKFPASDRPRIGDICTYGSHTVKSPGATVGSFGDQAQGRSVVCHAVERTVQVTSGFESQLLLLTYRVHHRVIQPFQTVFQSVKWE